MTGNSHKQKFFEDHQLFLRVQMGPETRKFENHCTKLILLQQEKQMKEKTTSLLKNINANILNLIVLKRR